jgi:hypothetical protein
METLTIYPQCTDLRAKQGFQFRNPRTNRMVTIEAGTVLWVSSSMVAQQQNGLVMLCRKSQPMGAGWYFAPAMVAEHFEAVR